MLKNNHFEKFTDIKLFSHVTFFTLKNIAYFIDLKSFFLLFVVYHLAR